MRPQDLFIEAAKQVQPDSYGQFSSSERQRLDELGRTVRHRAAELMNRVFECFADDSAKISDDAAVKQRFDDIQDGYRVWSGESKITVVPDGYGNETEVTRRWVSLEVPAEEEFNAFAPDGFYVKKQVLVGAHDLRFSWGGGQSWSEPSRGASLEVITGLFIEPEQESGYADLDDGTVYNPFEYGPVILERLNYQHPVFRDNNQMYYRGITEVPTPQHYPTPHALIEAVHASLDDFEKALH